MTVRQQWLIVAAIVAVLGVGLIGGSYAMKDELHPVDAGGVAPDFHAKELGSPTMRTMADYKGQVIILNVWATWCLPCREELPSLEKLYQQYGPKGLKLIAVSVDHGVSEDSIRAFANHYGITFDVLHDQTGGVEAAYQTTGYPETFVIGREGTIRKKWIGAADWSSLGNRALVAQLLGLEPPRPVADSGDR